MANPNDQVCEPAPLLKTGRRHFYIHLWHLANVAFATLYVHSSSKADIHDPSQGLHMTKTEISGA